MGVVAETCPNCGAPLTVEAGRCSFCKVPIQLSGRSEAATVPVPPTAGTPDDPFAMRVDDVFSIAGRGTVVTGQIAAGTVRKGDRLVLVSTAGIREVRCSAVERRRKKLDAASAGQIVGLLLDDLAKDEVSAGDVLRSS